MYNFSVSQALPVAFAFDVSNVPGTDLSTVPSATSTTEAASVDTGLAQPAQDSFAFLFDAADGSATVSDSTSSQTRTFGSGETTLSFDWSGNQGSSWIPGSGWGRQHRQQ